MIWHACLISCEVLFIGRLWMIIFHILLYGRMTAILLFSDMLIRKLDWWELWDGYNKFTVRYQKQRLHFHWKFQLNIINTHFQLNANSYVNKIVIDNEKNSNVSTFITWNSFYTKMLLLDYNITMTRIIMTILQVWNKIYLIKNLLVAT